MATIPVVRQLDCPRRASVGTWWYKMAAIWETEWLLLFVYVYTFILLGSMLRFYPKNHKSSQILLNCGSKFSLVNGWKWFIALQSRVVVLRKQYNLFHTLIKPLVRFYANVIIREWVQVLCCCFILHFILWAVFACT